MDAPRYAIGRHGGLVHIIHSVRQRRLTNGHTWLAYTWKCNRRWGADDAIELDEPGNRIQCKRCLGARDDTDEQRVYVARVGDMVKVGTSNQVYLRVADLKGEVIAWVPGGYDKERVVLEHIEATPVKGREWFPADAEEQILTVLKAVA